MSEKYTVIHKKSSVVNNGVPKLPSASTLEYGEIAINYGVSGETLSIKNSNDQIVSFSSDNRRDAVVNEVLGDIDRIDSAITQIVETMEENDTVVSTALGDLDDRLEGVENAGYITGFTESDPTVPAWAKESNKPQYTASEVGAMATSERDNYLTTATTIPSVDNYFDDAEYDSNTKRINLKHGNTVKKYIDATDFIKDGMVDDVEIATPTGGTNSGVTCLVVTFNTDAGKEDIEIPLSNIFNPNNYYTKNNADEIFLTTATTIPTATSQLTNDSHYVTTADTANFITGFTETQLSTGSTVGTGNAITSIEVSNHQITPTKGETFATKTEFDTHTGNTSIHVPSVTSTDNLKVLQVVNGAWTATTPTIVYSGSGTPSDSLGNNGDIYLQTAEMLRKPDVLYETDGTTGLLGHNQSSFADLWQLENLDMTPYKCIKAYIKCAATGDSSTYTSAIVVTVPLDPAAMGPTAYMGSAMAPLPFNRNRQFLVTCAVDSTKTKFQVVHENTLWDISTSDANDKGRYCYKIEGWY